METGADLVPRRDPLHRRDVQEAREGHLRQGRGVGGPWGLFNFSLNGTTSGLHEGDEIDDEALKALVCAAVAPN